MRENKNLLATIWKGKNGVFSTARQKQNIFIKYTFSLLLIFLLLANVFAGNENSASADRTLRSSGRVNPSTLGMEIDVPLGSYPGRGISVPINLSYSSKLWRMLSFGLTSLPGGNYSSCYQQYSMSFSEKSASGWTSSLAVPYIEYSGMGNLYNGDGSPISYDDVTCPNSSGGGGSYPRYYIRKMIVHLPGGETHELRADDTAISFPIGSNCIMPGQPCHPNDPTYAPNWNTTFYAVDGSNIKYVQNSSNNTYRLLMPDGSFYDFDASTPHGGDRQAVKFADRNGNYTTYYGPGSVDSDGVTHPNGYWKDTLGRNLSIPLAPVAPYTPTTASNPQIYKIPGVTGTYKLQWKQLNGGTQAESAITDINAPDYQLKSYGDTYVCGGAYCTRPAGSFLFGGDGNSIIMDPTIFNPVVLTEIELPTGQKYKFTYDIYGRIEQIIYPTGGKEIFQYGVVATLSELEPGNISGQTNFGVVNRKVYPNANEAEYYEWTYSNSGSGSGLAVVTNAPNGTSTERYLHQGISYSQEPKFGYDNGLAGMSYEERAYSASPKRLLSKKLTTWTKNQLNGMADWHPRIAQEESILYDALGNGVSTTTKYTYEDEANLYYRDKPVLMKKSSEYAFVTAGSSLPANPVRTTENTFLINDSTYGAYYKNQNMVGLIAASEVKDAQNTVVARSETKYDEGGDYSLIPTGTTTNWQNPNNIYRGNATTERVWDSTKGLVTNAGAYVATHAQFDYFGNQRKVWDAMGNVTETDYTSPSGQDYKFAYPTKVTTPIPDPNPSANYDQAAHGAQTAFETTATFDFTTGLPLTSTDANGLETRIEYDPVTMRRLNTKSFYQNSQVGSQAETIYHDQPNNSWVKSRTQIDTNKWDESITYYDGLGRPYLIEQVNSQGNIFVEKKFDADGRVESITNPFRNGETKRLTTNVYDEAGRIKEVILPDGAKVKTDYGVSTTTGFLGVEKTVTDQAGKKRKGISDALGRMIRVTEDPTGQNLNTDYVFDTLDNLRKTIQGDQSRYFSYDSLGRLLRAKQPEQEVNTALALPVADSITNHNQWSVKYEYDDNGNITKTTDARNVFVEGKYDKFNRIILKNYSDSTPDVGFYYDGTGIGAVPNFSKGQTTKVTSSVSETRYTSFDNLGRLLSSEQRTPFSASETVATATPRVSQYQYNMSGALVQETYPSGRVVTNAFNQDGELESVSGTKPNQTSAKVYLNQITYNAAGMIEKLRLGNGRWETAQYNERLQVKQIGLGYSGNDKSLLKLDYDYGTNLQNNGSLREQKINYTGLASEIKQSYIYDDLNRLKSATETYNNGANQSWKQTFDYDRYGNREFNTTNGNTTTLNQSLSWKVTDPAINTSDNRLKKDQDNDSITDYDYDKAGNLTLDAENKRFVYDAENRQTAFFKGTNSSQYADAAYQYDGDGKRVRKISNNIETIFVYNASGQLIAEYSNQMPEKPKVSYLTADHLGSPRIITDEVGRVISRHDYMAFGNEVSDTIGNAANRTTTQGYGKEDEIRTQYTGYERDDESGLDFAQARYYSSSHGRYTSIDPLTASADIKNPQTFNRYSYVLNSPYKFVDPLGLISQSTGACGNGCQNSDSGIETDSGYNDITKNFASDLPNRQITITGGTAEQRAAIQAAIDTLRAQSPTAEFGFGIFEGTEAGYSLEIEILEDKDFDKRDPKVDGKKAAAITTNNGGGNFVDKEAGENAKIFIRSSVINVSQENSDRKANVETRLEGVMAHELGHAYDIASNVEAWHNRNQDDKKLSYEEKRNEQFADASLQWISLERGITSGVTKLNSGVHRFKKTTLTETRKVPRVLVIE